MKLIKEGKLQIYIGECMYCGAIYEATRKDLRKEVVINRHGICVDAFLIGFCNICCGEILFNKKDDK